ncbi:MAG: PDZ domain-containing protein [Dehalococcoidia bacterium]|nr:PDZ domain-containing protein [Dehalococcoidia bacterium]
MQHTYWGISGGAITPDLTGSHNFPVDSGIFVVTVAPNGPAANAGLKGSDTTNPAGPTGGDVFTEVDGKAVSTVQDLSNYIDTKKVGDTVTLTVIRNNQTMKVKVVLGAWPASSQS